jgi:hypothetical protein
MKKKGHSIMDRGGGNRGAEIGIYSEDGIFTNLLVDCMWWVREREKLEMISLTLCTTSSTIY